MSNQASLGDISSSGESEERTVNTQHSKLELGPFTLQVPEEWRISQFSEDINLVNGVNYESKHYCDEGEGRIFLTLNSVKKGGGFKKEGIKHYGGPVDEEKILSPGDLLIANTDLTQDGDVVGYPFQVPEFPEDDREIVPSMDLSIMELQSEKYNKSFLQYLFRTNYIHSRLRSFSAGSTVLHLNTDLTQKMDLPVPPKPEQRRIASILYNVDQAIHKTEEIIEQTQRVKKGLMQDLLIGKGYGEEKKSIQIGPEEFKIPEKWDKKGLEELIDIQSGDYFKKKNFVDEGVRCLKIDNVGYGRIFWETETHLPESYLEKHQDLVLEEGDLLMAMNRPITNNQVKVGLVEEKDTPSILYQRVGRFHTDEGTDSRFLKFALRGFIFKKELKRRLSGTNQPYVNNDDIYSIEIPYPPLEVQREIADRLTHLDNQIELYRKEREQLQRLKKGLMQDLLTGEARTSESVEVLDEVREVEQ